MYQLTAVDTFTRWAIAWIVIASPTKETSVAFFGRIHNTWQSLGFPIQAVMADNGLEYKANDFTSALAVEQVDRVWIPARSPNHNAVVERFQVTMRQECWPSVPSPLLHPDP